MAIQYEKWHFTVEEYKRMGEVGILSEDDRVELIEGEIVKMSPIGHRHAGCVNRLTMLLTGILGTSSIVSVQNPTIISDISAPQPDLTVLRMRPDFYADKHPIPADILLLVEVADTSIGYDRAYKIPLYARGEVAEVWLVDLQAGVVTGYSQPTSGGYKIVSQVQGSQVLTSQTIPALAVCADEIIGQFP